MGNTSFPALSPRMLGPGTLPQLIDPFERVFLCWHSQRNWKMLRNESKWKTNVRDGATEQQTWGTQLPMCDVRCSELQGSVCHVWCVCCVRLTSESCSINIYQSVRAALNRRRSPESGLWNSALNAGAGKGDSAETLHAGRCPNREHSLVTHSGKSQVTVLDLFVPSNLWNKNISSN